MLEVGGVWFLPESCPRSARCDLSALVSGWKWTAGRGAFRGFREKEGMD